MNSSQQTRRRTMQAQRTVGAMEVMTVGVRVAGHIPTRLDLHPARTSERQLGLSLGAVLVYVSSYLVARAVAVAVAWGQAAPLARSLSPVLPVGRRPVAVTGSWSVATMVRMFGVPTVDTMLMPAAPGRNVPTMLRMHVGPITWELADAAAYTSLLNAWRDAADLLAATVVDD